MVWLGVPITKLRKPTEPAPCSVRSESTCCTDHVVGSGVPSSHALSRIVVGFAPTTWAWTRMKFPGVKCAWGAPLSLLNATGAQGRLGHVDGSSLSISLYACSVTLLP